MDRKERTKGGGGGGRVMKEYDFDGVGYTPTCTSTHDMI